MNAAPSLRIGSTIEHEGARLRVVAYTTDSVWARPISLERIAHVDAMQIRRADVRVLSEVLHAAS